MGLNKFCCRCDTIIGYRDKYCEKCQEEIDKQAKERFDTYLRVRKATGQDKEVYRKYKENRVDEKEQRFYNSKAWKELRGRVMSLYKYTDIYAYYKHTEVKPATLLHHIIEVKEDFTLKDDKYNLIPLSEKSHSEIHKLMNEGVESRDKIIAELKEMLEKFRKEFNINI